MKKILSVVLVVALVFAMTASIAEAKDVKDLKLGFILGSREHHQCRSCRPGLQGYRRRK